MDWTASIDGYCERTDAALWSEPLNAVTNAAFLIAALVMWWRTRRADLPLTGAMVLLLALVGISSALWHTLAQAWAGAADSGSIALFILLYLYAANRHYLGWPVWASVLGMLAFLPYAGILTPVFESLPFFRISAFYWPVPLLIFGYAAVLRRSMPDTARGLALGGALLLVSLGLRSSDEALCGALPMGTHFLWHVLNGVLLGWMIEVYRRHLLAGQGAGG